MGDIDRYEGELRIALVKLGERAPIIFRIDLNRHGMAWHGEHGSRKGSRRKHTGCNLNSEGQYIVSSTTRRRLGGAVMKLHEKILTHYLSCSSPVDKEGYLYKKGERNTSYQKRWFVLKGNLLFYKERPVERDLLGVIVLEGCSVQLCESEEQHAFSLVFSGVGHRIYKFAAEDQKSQESWIKALLCANHQYLSLLVKDLEKQYKDIKRATFSGNSNQCSTIVGPDVEQLPVSMATVNSGSSAVAQLPTVREGRSHSANLLLRAYPASGKSTNTKSPKLWPKRNAHVTPINGPAPLGEWPLLGSGRVEHFAELHEYYGREVKELRADWLRRKGEQHVPEGDLIDFG